MRVLFAIFKKEPPVDRNLLLKSPTEVRQKDYVFEFASPAEADIFCEDRGPLGRSVRRLRGSETPQRAFGKMPRSFGDKEGVKMEVILQKSN